MARIIFTAHGSTTAFGNFEPGTRATVGESLARHLVEVGVAKFDVPAFPAARPAPQPVEQVQAPPKGRRRKQ